MTPISLCRCLAGLAFLAVSATAPAQDEFSINEGLSGSWFNPATSGQGFLIDVVPADNFVFVAWFTFEEAAAKVGDPQNRWLTAQGGFSGAIADLTLVGTTGGVFDDPTPVDTQAIGSLQIEFSSCTEAVARYQFDDGGPAGEIPLIRLSPDVFCADLSTPTRKAINVTYIGNQGVVIDDGEVGIAIDAVGNWGSPWISVPASIASQLQNATAPFAHIGVAAVTHNHGDHFQTSAINNFLGASSQRRSILTPSARGGVTFSQTETITPARFASTRIDYTGFSVTIVNTRHFNQFGNDFSMMDNYTYVVEIDGRTVIHTGDIDYAADNFQAIADVLTGPVDAIVIPTFNTLISDANRDLIQQFFAPTQVIGAHFRSTNFAQESQAFQTRFPEGVVFDQPLEAVVLP